MAGIKHGKWDKAIVAAARRRWSGAASGAEDTSLPELRRQRSEARKVKKHLDDLIFVADGRLALPAIGNQSFPRPADSDWAWRPDLWCGPLANRGMSSVQPKSMLGREVTLFHDCMHSELTLRQLRNVKEEDLAAYGLRMDVFKFDGSYLSLAIDLPQDATQGLKKKHLIRLSTIIETEKPLEIFARLNIQHGPNTEQIVRELPLYDDVVMLEFDLAYSNMNEKRVEKLWLDLIFEGPQFNQVIVRDLTFSRRIRAAL